MIEKKVLNQGIARDEACKVINEMFDDQQVKHLEIRMKRERIRDETSPANGIGSPVWSKAVVMYVDMRKEIEHE